MAVFSVTYYHLTIFEKSTIIDTIDRILNTSLYSVQNKKQLACVQYSIDFKCYNLQGTFRE